MMIVPFAPGGASDFVARTIQHGVGQILGQQIVVDNRPGAGGMIGYGVMSLAMTTTPLAMIDCSYSFGDAAFVIQWHVLGMFLPSFFTGHLVARFGALRIMSAGAGLLLCCAAVNLSGVGLWQFWAALVLLGMGWNFLYIGS